MRLGWREPLAAGRLGSGAAWQDEKQKGPNSVESAPALLLPSCYLPRCPAYEGSFATCVTSLPGGMSGDTTLSTSAVAVWSLT